jgi:hypothetical protein
MKVKLLTSLVRDKESYGFGEVVELSEIEAVRFVEKGLAEPVNKKEFNALLKKLEQEKKEKEEKEKLLKVQMEKERLEAELNSLYAEVVEKEALLAGVVLSDEEKFKLVEELKNRDSKVTADENKDTK